ncbi:hypothetical protein ACQPZZ_15430 [Microbispora sp. CA-135349]|uniref:hypothetical protein n=1 Tax=Microbispora sp. CA-135349 TaxID=3239953 RepID=UPI003D8A96C2
MIEGAGSPQEPSADEAAFELLVERHRGEIYTHCYWAGRASSSPSSPRCNTCRAPSVRY